jgi:hypothetical protein
MRRAGNHSNKYENVVRGRSATFPSVFESRSVKKTAMNNAGGQSKCQWAERWAWQGQRNEVRTERSARNSTSGTHVNNEESTTELRNVMESWIEPRKLRIDGDTASWALARYVGSRMMAEGWNERESNEPWGG